MSASIELQFINKLIQDKSLDALTKYKIEPHYFLAFKPVVDYILEHETTYHQVPDKLTVSDKFEIFKAIDVQESHEYLAHTLLEQALYRATVPVIQESAKLLTENANEATQYLIEHLEKLKEHYTIAQNNAYDIVKQSKERYQEYELRVHLKGLLGISTGIKGLDQILNGFLPEDLVIILARTNEGKSWLLLYFLVQAWLQGKRVLMYSGEMSKTIVGFRFDTLFKNISNVGLMTGGSTETKNQKNINYEQYINDLSEWDIPFLVITQKELNGNDLDTLELGRLIKEFKPDIIGIDQISLMHDHKNAENRRIQLANISKDLYTLTERYQVPILSVAQANRDAAKDKKKNSTSVPGIEQIADSDDIARNATRILSMGQITDMLKVKNIKNRYGVVNQEVLLSFDFNYGLFQEIEDTIFNQDTTHLF